MPIFKDAYQIILVWKVSMHKNNCEILCRPFVGI